MVSQLRVLALKVFFSVRVFYTLKSILHHVVRYDMGYEILYTVCACFNASF